MNDNELDQGHLAGRTKLPLPGSVAVIVLIVVVSIVVVHFVVVLVIVVLVVVVLIDIVSVVIFLVVIFLVVIFLVVNFLDVFTRSPSTEGDRVYKLKICLSVCLSVTSRFRI